MKGELKRDRISSCWYRSEGQSPNAQDCSKLINSSLNSNLSQDFLPAGSEVVSVFALRVFCAVLSLQVTRCIVEVLSNALSKPNAPPINPECKEILRKSKYSIT